MRKRLHEASDNDIILSSIYELTHLYDENGNEVPSYFNIKEIIDNYGLSQKDVIDIAKTHNYNVFRIPGGDDLVNTIVIAHEDLSYGDVVKEDTTKIDIKELGDDTDDSFNMEEDMEEVKPWGQRKIYDQIKQDTNNFTIEKDEYIYAFEEECELAYKILEKKYEDVDYWFTDNAFSPTGESWHISFSNPIKGKKKVVKEDVSHPLVGKKVIYKDEECTIENVDEDEDDILFTLSNGKEISVKTCVEKGIISSDDVEVNKLFDTFKVKEEPKEVKSIEEPKVSKSDEEIYREKAREDFYASNKISSMYKYLESQLKKGLSLISYEMAYYQEYRKLLNSPIEKARRRTNNSNITVAKTYRGDVDELINWLKKAIVRIDVFTNEDNKDDIESIVTELNKQHGTDYEAKINTSKDGDQFVVTITSDENILKDMPEEFKTWVAPKNLGLHRANAEKVDALVYNDKNRKLTSNGIIKDLLYNYGFKLGDYKEKNESIDREIDDGPEHGYATVADYERGQEILDEMSALREKERIEEERLIKAWAVEKTMSNKEFHKQSEELHTSTQEKVEKLYQELVALPVKKNESIAYKQESLEEGLETKIDEHGNKYLEFALEKEAKDYFDKNANKLPDGVVMYVNKIYFGKDELEEDIEKHDTLNPKLFDNEELKPEVKEAIQKIVDEFIKELNEDEVNFTLKDIILLGSNVSYNYTKDSDLDIHLIADSSALDCPESLIDKLYGAYRSIFNKNYDITIKDIPAEIYVELDEPKAMSNGIYSLNNGWIKKPEAKEIPDLDEEAFDNLFTIWEDDYFDLLERDSTSDEVAQFIENIYELRKESIAEEGEYGLGNLVFKEFRNLGYLDRLKDLRKELKGKELSLESIDNSTNEEYNNVEVENMIDKKKIQESTKEDMLKKYPNAYIPEIDSKTGLPILPDELFGDWEY